VSWALLEVVVNAGEASGRGHPVQVAWRRGDTLELAVLNVGKGWDPQIPRDPPVPFYTTKGKHEGLGLAIAGRLCLAMGGTLTLVTDLPDVTAVKIAGVPARSV
jgi:phosphoglycerate-specific signal transduction histidine kinase